MKQIQIPKDGVSRSHLLLEYDDKTYQFEYIKSKKLLLLRRCHDDKIIGVFKGDILFVSQCNLKMNTHFLVSISKKNGKTKLYDYIEHPELEHLVLKESFQVFPLPLDKLRITDSSYLISSDGTKQDTLYNLEKTSKQFDVIYNDKNLQSYFVEPTVLVQELVQAEKNKKIQLQDTLIYGIHPETFQINTNIWSDLQQRFIPIYQDDKIKALKQKEEEQEQYWNFELTKEEITILYEVKKPLDEIASHFNFSRQIYEDNNGNSINEGFIKQFTKK